MAVREYANRSDRRNDRVPDGPHAAFAPSRCGEFYLAGGPAMDARRGIAKGMTVFTRDGEKLGKVVSVDEKGLFVEKGHFFPKELGFPFEDVDEVRGDGVHLRLDRAAAAHALR